LLGESHVVRKTFSDPASFPIRLSDRTVTLLLTKAQVWPKSGVQYFGIQVDDLKSVKRRLQDGGVALSENVNGQIKLEDPEGNQVIVSENGW